MDDSTIESLEKFFYQKIMLYDDLLDCFKKERESLINVDLDKLWAISKEKEAICSKITSIREEIISAASPGIDQKSFNLNQILDVIPAKNRDKFQKLYQALMKSENEIEVLRKENAIFIDDSLRFLDEMISIITGDTKSKTMYDDKCHLSRSGANILLSREA